MLQQKIKKAQKAAELSKEKEIAKVQAEVEKKHLEQEKVRAATENARAKERVNKAVQDTLNKHKKL